jgi:hypothetical protein
MCLQKLCTGAKATPKFRALSGGTPSPVTEIGVAANCENQYCYEVQAYTGARPLVARLTAMERAGGTVRGYVVSQVPSELMEEPSGGADMNAAADDGAASP